MDVSDVSPALRERLGAAGTVGLLSTLELTRDEWAAAVIDAAVERFELRLTQELGALRTEMQAGDAALRLEMRDMRAAISKELAAVRLDMSSQRTELFKWSIALWLGQFLGLGALMAAFMRA